MITTVVCMRAPGHDDVPDADLHLEHPGDVAPGAARVPAAHRGAVRAGGRPAPGRARLRPGQRRSPVVAAPVLVLRPPRGLHHRAAVLRDRHRDLPGVLPQADLRLHHAGVRDAVDRRVVGRGVGAPHVRHRRRSAAVLLVHDVPDRGADRDQVLQLDRHDVEGPADLRDADAVLGRLPGDLPAGRPDRCAAGQPADRLPRHDTLLRGRALPLRAVRHHRVRHLRRASTSGSRR